LTSDNVVDLLGSTYLELAATNLPHLGGKAKLRWGGKKADVS